MVPSTRLRPRPSRTSTSRCPLRCRESTPISSTRVTLTPRLLNGTRKPRIWPPVSSRTSSSSPATRLGKRWLRLVRNCKQNHNHNLVPWGTAERSFPFFMPPAGGHKDEAALRVLSLRRPHPSICHENYYEPMYPFMMPRLLLRTKRMISSRSFEAGNSASMRSMASLLFSPDW